MSSPLRVLRLCASALSCASAVMNAMNSETIFCIMAFVGDESFIAGEVVGREAFISREILERGSCVALVADWRDDSSDILLRVVVVEASVRMTMREMPSTLSPKS